MKIKNKGFTLVELLAVIVVIAIIGGIASLSMSIYLSNSKDNVYRNYAATLKTTVENYLIENYEKNSSIIPNIGSESTITLNQLITANKIDTLKDPNGGVCDTNSSKVIVKREEDTGINFNLSYYVTLECPHATIVCNEDTAYTNTKDCKITKK